MRTLTPAIHFRWSTSDADWQEAHDELELARTDSSRSGGLSYYVLREGTFRVLQGVEPVVPTNLDDKLGSIIYPEFIRGLARSDGKVPERAVRPEETILFQGMMLSLFELVRTLSRVMFETWPDNARSKRLGVDGEGSANLLFVDWAGSIVIGAASHWDYCWGVIVSPQQFREAVNEFLQDMAKDVEQRVPGLLGSDAGLELQDLLAFLPDRT